MRASVSGSSGRIFISYRHDDAQYPASWLFELLANHFGENQVFKDVSSIQLGEDFFVEIAAAVGSCRVLLAVIGDRWLTITDDDGRRRIDDPEDFVRLEIETALKRNILVIPVLVEGAQMPRQRHLPDALASLARRQSLELSASSFRADASRLLAVLEQALARLAVTDKVTEARDEAGSGLPSRGYELGSRQAAVLAGRSTQRDFADTLAVTWRQLADSWASMVTSAADLVNTTVRAPRPDNAQTSVLDELTTYLGAGSSWRERAASVLALIDELTGPVRALQQRMHRETVNIAVIGQVGAGKSTLLRKLSGLDENYIPSNRFSSTTATPSQIFPEPGARPGRAVLSLHTWESFRDEVLTPLHMLAQIGPPPMSLEGFRRFQYGDDVAVIPAAQAGVARYRRRLQLARDSLPSYQGLLEGGTQEITLDRLRPFVAYPADEDLRTEYRPYHGVRSVDIFCEFPLAGAVRLGLIDLPGGGDAGLDVHGRFLARLRDNADLLFIVTRPTRQPATDSDWDALQLADEAAAGVRRSDFTHLVINRDASVPKEYFGNALARARETGMRLGIDVRECDIESSTPEQVAAVILSPVLGMLTERLAYMDRDAAGKVLFDLAAAAARVESLASELVRWTESRQAELPDEEKRLRTRARQLKNQVGLELNRVLIEYDKLYESGAPIAELHEAIEEADREIREWLASGCGAGSTQEWLRVFRLAEGAHGMGDALDRQYDAARKKLIAVFGGIDACLKRSVDRLWAQVADALRVRLTEAIVPAGPDSHAVLAAFAARARRDGAQTLAEATDRLLALSTDYGSIFLRIGWPLIHKVSWYSEETNLRAPGLGAAAIGDRTADGASVTSGKGSVTTGEYATESHWYARLTGTVELVTAELEREFQSEAQRTLRVFAGAIALFTATATSTPGVEVEFERLTRPVQREIWPTDFDDTTAKFAADLAALRQRAAEMTATAGLVDSLAAQAGRLPIPRKLTHCRVKPSRARDGTGSSLAWAARACSRAGWPGSASWRTSPRRSGTWSAGGPDLAVRWLGGRGTRGSWPGRSSRSARGRA